MSKYLKSTKEVLQVQGVGIFLRKLNRFLLKSDHNEEIKKTIKQYSSEFDIFLDIGTNVGSIVLDVAKNFSKCICFEPTTKTYNEFLKRLDDSGITNIISYNCALGKQKGVAKLFISSSSSGDNRLHKLSEEKREIQDVDINTLDKILERINVNEKCMIKIDVQGSELDVMKGSIKTLQRNCLIISEFSPYLFSINNTDPYDYVRFMKSHGYSFYDLKGKKIKDEYLKRMCLLGSKKEHVMDDFLIKKV